MAGRTSSNNSSETIERIDRWSLHDLGRVSCDEKAIAADTLCLDFPCRDQATFEVSLLEARIRQLELIVHRLLCDKLNQKIADDWLDICQNDHSIILSANLIDDNCESLLVVFDRAHQQA